MYNIIFVSICLRAEETMPIWCMSKPFIADAGECRPVRIIKSVKIKYINK